MDNYLTDWLKKIGFQIFILLIFTCSPGLDVIAGTSGENDYLLYNLNVHYGAMMPHHDLLAILNEDRIKSFDLIAWFSHANKEQTNNSILGAGYIFSNLGNYEVFGNMHAAYMGLLSPHLINKIPVRFKIGLGAAYATKKHDRDNYLNSAIGSHLNAYGRLSFIGEIPVIEDKWILRPGISFHHISNGIIVAPNQGLNLLTFHAGLEFRSGQIHSGAMLIRREKKIRERNRFTFMVAPGIKQVHKSMEHQIFTSSLIFDYSYIYRLERSIGVGINFFYNDTWAHFPYRTTEQEERPVPFQSSVHLSLQRDQGPISFILHPGLYIYKPSEETPVFTNRLGVKYSFRNNLLVQFSIKHHWFAIADYFEWGIGYELNW